MAFLSKNLDAQSVSTRGKEPTERGDLGRSCGWSNRKKEEKKKDQKLGESPISSEKMPESGAENH